MTLQNRKIEFALSTQNRYASLNNKGNLSIKEINENFIIVLEEAPVEAGGKKKQKIAANYRQTVKCL